MHLEGLVSTEYIPPSIASRELESDLIDNEKQRGQEKTPLEKGPPAGRRSGMEGSSLG